MWVSLLIFAVIFVSNLCKPVERVPRSATNYSSVATAVQGAEFLKDIIVS